MTISKTAEPVPRIVSPVFSVDNSSWPIMTVFATICLLIVDGRVTLETEESFRFALGSGPVSGIYLLCLIIFLYKIFSKNRIKVRIWQQAINGKNQYFMADEQGIRYGYQDVQDVFLSWNAINSAEIRKSSMMLNLAGVKLSVDLKQFSPEETTEMRGMLENHKLLNKS